MELYEKAIKIAKEMGDRKNEAYANNKVGTIYYHLGDYGKGKPSQYKLMTKRVEPARTET